MLSIDDSVVDFELEVVVGVLDHHVYDIQLFEIDVYLRSENVVDLQEILTVDDSSFLVVFEELFELDVAL